jgi:hypothetical protein
MRLLHHRRVRLLDLVHRMLVLSSASDSRVLLVLPPVLTEVTLIEWLTALQRSTLLRREDSSLSWMIADPITVLHHQDRSAFQSR